VTSTELVCWPLVAVAVLAAAGFDLKRHRIPTWLPAGLLVACLGARLSLEGAGTAETGFLAGLLGVAGCAGPYAVLALSGPRVGWSDVLLLAGVGAGLGFPRALAGAFLISVIGAVFALGFVLWRRRGSATVPAPGVHASVDSARAIPYGLPIALGAIWAMAWAGPEVGVEGEGAFEPTMEVLDAGVEVEAGGFGEAPTRQ
jgi:Flp pilus assembly protein protease CpaA